MTRGPKPKPILDRLMAKVEITDTCWLWIGHVMPNGYGTISAPGRSSLVHRVSYEEHVGPIPEGNQIDHRCRVRNCVRPDHLEPVTGAENVRRAGAAKTHCKHGHELTTENTYVEPTHHRRSCVTCRHAAEKRYQAKRAQRTAA